MARMVPDYIHHDCKSNAERNLFERFKQELPDDFWVLHSLGLAKHSYKLASEIDFVIVHSRGLLCVEVKGGRISQKNGRWYFTNRYEDVNVKTESPFQQASSAMYALQRSLWNKFGNNAQECKGIIGYTVIFPDQHFSVDSPEWDLKRLIDLRIFSLPMAKLVNDQYDYSEKELWQTKQRKCVDLTIINRENVLQFLRPDFEIIPSLATQISETHNQQMALTEEQYDILDQLEENNRTLISGSAGTGKTLLALEKVRREASRNKSVMFVCYNQFLSNHVRSVLRKDDTDNSIEVNTLHGFSRKIIGQAGLDDELPIESSSNIFTEQFPMLFERAFVEVYDNPPFDVLVIDEGQDLKFDKWLRMLDWLLEGGFKKGRWTWFEDNQQNIFRPKLEASDTNKLIEYGPAVFKLVRNCRNTKPISIFNSLATATEKQKCLVDSGLKVIPSFYTSNRVQLKMIENILTQLLGGGIKPVDIILLSAFTKENSVLQGLNQLNGINLEDYTGDAKIHENVLRLTTIQKFKGLESKAVIVTDITDMDTPDKRSLNYVAFSRPTAYLEVLVHENCRKQFTDLAYQFGLRR